MFKRLFGKLFKKVEEIPETVPKAMPKKKDLEISFATTTPDLVEIEPIGEIEVLIDNQKIDTYYLATNPSIIGRDPSQSNIIISELIVSKKHCTIYWENTTVHIRDNNSTNGVYINNQRVREQELRDNDVIMLGKKGTVKLLFKKRGGDKQ